MNGDYYAVLGIDAKASPAEIHDAYRRLARLYHPDVSGADTQRDFRRVQEAWETLGDQERRQAYDYSRINVSSSAGPQKGRGPESAWPTPESALHLELWLDRDEVRRGGSVRIDLPGFAPCFDCGGAGEWFFGRCPGCAGQGYVLAPERFTLRVPPGLRQGQVFEIPLQGWELFHRSLVLYVRWKE